MTETKYCVNLISHLSFEIWIFGHWTLLVICNLCFVSCFFRLDAYLYCKYKAYLLHAGAKCVWHEYGAFLVHEQMTIEAAAKESLLRKLDLTSAPSKKHIRLPDLETGSPILFGGSISRDSYSFKDGIHRTWQSVGKRL